MDDEDQVSLKALYEDNDNMIDMLEESIDHCKVTGEKEVVSDYGVKGIVYLYNHWMDTDIGRMDGKGWFYCFPSPDRKSTRLNSSHVSESRMPSSA